MTDKNNYILKQDLKNQLIMSDFLSLHGFSHLIRYDYDIWKKQIKGIDFYLKLDKENIIKVYARDELLGIRIETTSNVKNCSDLLTLDNLIEKCITEIKHKQNAKN